MRNQRRCVFCPLKWEISVAHFRFAGRPLARADPAHQPLLPLLPPVFRVVEDNKTNMAKLKVGLIGGGGPGNFFGGVHKRAISLDGSRELVAGALRSDPDAAMVAADDYGIEGFPDYRAMIDACVNGALELDYVTIVTPNHAHFAPAKAFLEAGIPVLCEKPITMTVAEAEELEQIVGSGDVPFILALGPVALRRVAVLCRDQVEWTTLSSPIHYGRGRTRTARDEEVPIIRSRRSGEAPIALPRWTFCCSDAEFSTSPSP